jgi:Ca2+-transporting ATPase
MTNGLTQEQADYILRRDGFNELATAKPKKLISIIVEIIKEPMISLLLAGGILYLLLGDKTEAIMLLFSIFVVVGISLYQEKRTEKSLYALAQLSSPRAVVIRNGQEKRIAGREVVLGDLVILTEGDRVPADIKLIEAVNLSIDESLLTGESQPVEKDIAKNGQAYSGSLIVKGHGLGQVVATGIKSEIGKISGSLKSIEIEKTLLQKEIKLLIKWLAIIGLIMCGALAITYIATKGGIVDGLLAGLTLAIGILPEEFPIVLLIFMAVGAWRLAKINVLTRRAATIETLGAATVLCVDKTGTITKNKMTIDKIMTGKAILLNGFEDERDIIKYGIMASQQKPFDPLETAFIEAGKQYFSEGDLYQNFKLIKEYPLDVTSLSVAHVYKEDSGGYIVALKGAPEAVADLCHLKDHQKILAEVSAMAKDGLRVIAVAKGAYQKDQLPKDRHEIKFEFLGLVGLKDPIRSGVKESVELANKAGIRIIMITGDHKETALDVAKHINLKTNGVITGSDFEGMTQQQRRAVLTETSVFSRVVPHQKLLIVEELKKMGEIVAMTGDGVNDAPALKSAHIGIAMGLRGTDVAREASPIVLLDDDFNSIIDGVKTGRRIYDNLQKAINYLISIHIPIVILAILPVIFGVPLILMPIHIVFLEFIIDPTCTLVFESDKADKDIMLRKPRRARDKIISLKNLLLPIIRGVVIGLIVFMAYYHYLPSYGEKGARTFAFVLFVSLNIILIFVNLSKNENIFSKIAKNDNRALIAVILITLLIMVLSVKVNDVMNLFNFGNLQTSSLWQIATISLIFLILSELFKYVTQLFGNKDRRPAPISNN